MRERTRLEESMSAFSSLESELKDTIELIELAEAEGDAAMVADAERALKDLAKRAKKAELEALLSRRSRRQ